MSNEELRKRGMIRSWHCPAYNRELTERAKEMRNHMTLAEEKLWVNFLPKYKYIFRAQKQIENYIVNFYCAKLKLVIEIDGKIHAEHNMRIYDEERTKVFESYGIKVLRFKNEEIINDFDDICRRISECELHK